MNALDLIRWASCENIDLNIRDGRLFVRTAAPIPPDLAAVIRAHKPAVIACLEDHATIAARREEYARRCPPLTLTDAERIEAETLAPDLAASGTLGHFVFDLCTNWTALDERDRVAACLVWQLALSHQLALEHAA
jgi:hypothetical protein